MAPHQAPRRETPARLVVLVSGSGTNLQAVLEACRAPDYGARVVAVGADRDDIAALERAKAAGVPTFVVRLRDHPDRRSWDDALADAVAAHQPDLIVSAGFMKLVSPDFLARFGGRMINTHPALLPSFPGMRGVADALAYGVKVTGCTVFFVDAGVDSGPVIAQRAVPVLADDDEPTLTERVKVVERALLVETIGQLARSGYQIHGRQVVVGAGPASAADPPAGASQPEDSRSPVGESHT